jgi:hypothetical protein
MVTTNAQIANGNRIICNPSKTKFTMYSQVKIVGECLQTNSHSNASMSS